MSRMFVYISMYAKRDDDDVPNAIKQNVHFKPKISHGHFFVRWGFRLP